MFDRETAKELAREKGLTPRELAPLVGVSERQMWRYESGEFEPSFSVAERLADVLGVPLERLRHEPEAATASTADGTKTHEAPNLPPSGDSRVDGAKVGAR